MMIMKELRAMMQDHWQPIETAPKDGTEIFGGAMLSTGWWYQHVSYIDDGFYFRNDGKHGRAFLTHWQPLPEPPLVAVSTQEETSVKG